MTYASPAASVASPDVRGAALGSALGAIATFMYFVALLGSRFVLASADPHAFGAAFDGLFDVRMLAISLATLLVILAALSAFSSRSTHRGTLRAAHITSAALMTLSILLQASVWAKQHSHVTILARDSAGTFTIYDGEQTSQSTILGYAVPAGPTAQSVHHFAPSRLMKQSPPKAYDIAGDVFAAVRYGSFKNNRFAWHMIASVSASFVMLLCAIGMVLAAIGSRSQAISLTSARIGVIACGFWLFSTLTL